METMVKIYKENIAYFVRWVDHCSDAGDWRTGEVTHMSPIVIDSVGWVVVDTEDYVTISQQFHKDGDFRTTSSHMTILKTCIKKSFKLKDL